MALLERHPYSAIQLFQRMKEEGYEGGYSILKKFVRTVRPQREKAFLSLHFEPGECAQIDWGHCGMINVGNTRRRLSVFVMTLAYSRMIFLRFTLLQTMEHFLDCQQKAFEFFGGVPKKVMVDNLKSAVLSHPRDAPATYHPRYTDFAGHFGFDIRACNVRAPHEKGRVENGVRYVKINFLSGLELPDFAALNPAAQAWCDTIANVHIHGETHKKPVELFREEKAALRPLPSAPCDVGIERVATANSRFRVILDTNRYSVPAEYAGHRLRLRLYPEELLLYHENQLIAQHPRSYQRHRDHLKPDHERQLLQQRRQAAEQKLLIRFLTLCPQAETYYQHLKERRLNPRHHIRQILALAEIYEPEKVARALQDALELGAFSSDYILNLLEQRSRLNPSEPAPLPLTRREDLLELELPPPNLNIYDPPKKKNA